MNAKSRSASSWRLTVLLVIAACLSFVLLHSAACGHDAAAGAAAQQATLAGRSFSQLYPAITPDMVRYSRARYALFFFSIFYEIGCLLAILQLGIANRLRNIARRSGRGLIKQVIVYSLLFSSVIFLFNLPLSIAGGFWLEHHFGLSVQPLSSFLVQKLQALLVFVVVLSIGLSTWTFIVRRFRRHWPIIVFLVCVPYFAVEEFAQPLIVDPLFNHFEPMSESSTRAAVERLAVAAHIPDAAIFVTDKSKQTRKINAYVTGVGSSNRIVIWDNTLKDLPEPELLAVVAHEIGHYVLGHIYIDFLVAILGGLLLVPFGYLLVGPILARLPARWGVRSLGDLTVTPLAMAFFIGIGFLSLPAANFLSRYQEHQADAFGLELTDDPASMARLFVRLSERNLSEPDPPELVKIWLFSHPTLKERIDYCLEQSGKRGVHSN